MSNAMSLKAKIRNIAKKKNIPAQVILQNYMFERLLVRLSVSDYREKLVLKGGMLVAAIVGLDNRATMDLDTTLKNLPLTPDAIHSALEQICAIRFDDGVSFEIGTISPIREDDIYGGYRVMLNAWFDTIVTPLSIDVSTGDAITPHAVQYNFSEIFDDEKTYELWAYNIETVMAEKVETILRRSVFNTRPRDFYDAYILATTQKFDQAVFENALQATANHRDTARQIEDVPGILRNIEESPELKTMWERYRKQFTYKNICEIGKERIRRAGEKIQEARLEAIALSKHEWDQTCYYVEHQEECDRLGHLPDEYFEKEHPPIDTGFRVLKLDDTNMKDVYYAPDDYDQGMIAGLESNIKDDRTDLDLLFGCLIDWGLPLSLPYKSEQLGGCTVHTYNDGDLIACFDANIPESVVKEIAQRRPLRAVFRDSGFASSPEKINVFEIFKLYMPEDANDISKRVRVI